MDPAEFSQEVPSEHGNLFSCYLCGPSALTDSKHHFGFSCDAKVHKGRTVKNGAFKGWCYFIYTKRCKYPSRHSPFIFPSHSQPAGHTDVWLWPDCIPLPCCLRVDPGHAAALQEEALLASVGQGYRKQWRGTYSLPNLLFVP